MAQKHTAVEVQDPTGNQVRAVSQENDFPLPPVDELRKLHEFRPDLVDKIIGSSWIFRKTAKNLTKQSTAAYADRPLP